jgi:hypothetical protein
MFDVGDAKRIGLRIRARARTLLPELALVALPWDD